MRTITQPVYHQLMGLFLLHRMKEAERRAIERTVAELVNEKCDFGEDYFGHVSDCLFGNESVDDMLQKLDIKILNVPD